MSELQTLVLSQGFEPLKVVPWQRAIELITLEKCEVIEEYDQEVRSAYLVIKVPAVVRLLKRFRKQHKPVKFSRINVYGRDDYKCQYCSKPCKMNDLTYDHVIPRSQGGKTVWENIVSCCVKCNSKKAGRTPQQAGMKLLKKPVQPSAMPAVFIQLSRKTVPDAWRDYLYWTGQLENDNQE
jgi:5-methylcytosine-specific restriction endonuclease McrA